MRYDDSLLKDLQEGRSTHFFRAYEWQQASITHSYNKNLPGDLMAIDHASRATGGGIVFHSPGDIVFSLGGYNKQGFLPQGFKEKIEWVSKKVTEALAQCKVQTTPSVESDTPQNIQFCNGYHNPYERMVGEQKCVAIAMRRFREVFMMQGVIHLKSNKEVFEVGDGYEEYLTEGLYGKVERSELQKILGVLFDVF